MADPEALFFWKHEATSGYGALDDFAVHPLSLIKALFGRVSRVMCDMAKPYADRKTASGARRAVETYDIASVLMHLENGVAGTLHGRTRWLELPAAVQVDAAQVTASGTARLKQTDFGITPFSVGAGLLSVSDELEVRYQIVARRWTPPANTDEKKRPEGR